MPEVSPEQRRQLEALKAAYAAELPDKVTAIAEAAAAIDLNRWDRVRIQELHHLVHRLAGSSAIWGFSTIRNAACELEEILLTAMEGTPPFDRRLSADVRRLLETLKHGVPAGTGPDGPSGPRPRRRKGEQS